MEARKLRALVPFILVAMGLLVGQSSAAFSDCYGKCFVLCVIEPQQTLCTCTTQCFKQCIFPMPPATSIATELHQATDNYGFCKLGCAFFRCSNISTKAKPNGGEVDDCVGSCSKMCSKGYLSP